MNEYVSLASLPDQPGLNNGYAEQEIASVPKAEPNGEIATGQIDASEKKAEKPSNSTASTGTFFEYTIKVISSLKQSLSFSPFIKNVKEECEVSSCPKSSSSSTSQKAEKKPFVTIRSLTTSSLNELIKKGKKLIEDVEDREGDIGNFAVQEDFAVDEAVKKLKEAISGLQESKGCFGRNIARRVAIRAFDRDYRNLQKVGEELDKKNKMSFVFSRAEDPFSQNC